LAANTNPIAVLLQGPGGIGKTTLTREAATQPAVIARFGPRRWFAELGAATDRDTEPRRVCRRLFGLSHAAMTRSLVRA
jgi:predicted ATPase